MRGNIEAKEKLVELQRQSEVFVTSITIFELFFGAYLSEASEKNLTTVTKLLAPFSKLSYSYSEAKLTGEFSADLQKKGSTIGLRDCMIAAITQIHNKILVTRNIKHFSRIPGLKLEKW